MPTIQIEGQPVQVSDKFMTLSPDEQNATVDEIASQMGIKGSQARSIDDSPAARQNLSDAMQAKADEMLVGPKSSRNEADTLTTTLGNVGSFNIARNLGAGIQTAADALGIGGYGGGSFSEHYDRLKRQDEALQRQNPGPALAGTAIGIGTGFLGGNAVAPAATMTGRAVQGAAIGAGMSGGGELLDSKDPVAAAKAAAVGGAVGLVATPIIEKAVGAFARMMTPRTVEAAVDEAGNLTPKAIAAAREAGLSDDDLANPQVANALKQSFAQKGLSAAAAREGVAGERGIGLTQGQAEQNYELQKREQGLLRGLGGGDAQEVMAAKLDPATGAQTSEIVGANKQMANDLGGQALGEDEIAQQLAARAAAAKAKSQGLYRDALGREGGFADGALNKIGASIRNRLTGGDNPLVIDDQLTPAATKALGVIDDLGAGRLTAGMPAEADRAGKIGTSAVEQAFRSAAGSAAPAAEGRASQLGSKAVADAFAAAGGPASRAKPVSMGEFIARNGGLPLDAEAQARNWQGVRIGGKPLVSPNGKSIDGHFREALIGAGYLPADADGYSSRDVTKEVYDALERELRGQKTYSVEDIARVPSAGKAGGAMADVGSGVEAQAKRITDALKADMGADYTPPDREHLYSAAEDLFHGRETDPAIAYERAVTRAGMDEPLVQAPKPAETGGAEVPFDLPQAKGDASAIGQKAVSDVLGHELGVGGKTSLNDVNLARKKLVAYARAAAPGSEDKRAVSKLIEAFDQHVEDAMTAGLFSGDQKAVDLWKQARSSWADYKGKFSPRFRGDDAGAMIEKIVSGNRSANEIGNAIWGASSAGAKGMNVRMAKRLETIFGRDSEMWQGIRQSLWDRVTTRPKTGEAWGPKALADKITGFLDRDGKEVAHLYYTKEERDAMRRYATVLRYLQPKQGTYSTSGTPGGIDAMKKMSGGVMRVLGPIIGGHFGGLPGMVIGAVADSGIKQAANMRNVRAAQAALSGAGRKLAPLPAGPRVPQLAGAAGTGVVAYGQRPR